MDACDEILKKDEVDSYELNEKIYGQVLEDFLNGIEEDYIFDNLFETSGEKVRTLKYELYTTEYIDYFFEILKKYNYRMKQEIKDAMFILGHLYNPNKNIEEIKRLLNSPVLDDISFNGKNIFTILSREYGKLSFELASYHFKDNLRMNFYIEHEQLPARCHHHVYYMSKTLPDLYAMTSLIPSYFKGNYYHSYTYNKERNCIIDLCYNSIIDKDEYYNIFEPKELSIIQNRKVEEELRITNEKTNQNRDRCQLLKITLYKQYLESIGYEGRLEDAPSTKIFQKK